MFSVLKLIKEYNGLSDVKMKLTECLIYNSFERDSSNSKTLSHWIKLLWKVRINQAK